MKLFKEIVKVTILIAVLFLNALADQPNGALAVGATVINACSVSSGDAV